MPPDPQMVVFLRIHTHTCKVHSFWGLWRSLFWWGWLISSSSSTASSDIDILSYLGLLQPSKKNYGGCGHQVVGVWSKHCMFVLQKMKKKFFWRVGRHFRRILLHQNFLLYDSAVNMRHRMHFVPTADETPYSCMTNQWWATKGSVS